MTTLNTYPTDPTEAASVALPEPPAWSQFTRPAWTSPAWWVAVLTAVAGVVTGLLSTFTHVHVSIPAATVTAAAFIAASVASVIIGSTHAKVRTAAINAESAARVAHYHALAAVHASNVGAAAGLHGAGLASPVPVDAARKVASRSRTTRR